MKMKIEVECTPVEARQLLGLPDVSGFQDAMMKEVKDRISGGLKAEDVEKYMNTMLVGAQAVQNQLFSFVSNVTSAAKKGK